uniref:Uncharacterized protein n=1 Tax=Schlesneria paludicola TaxID=360056 RepID=A0A7C4LN11_9PLAN
MTAFRRVALSLIVAALAATLAPAQTSSTKAKTKPKTTGKVNVKELDVRAVEMQKNLLRDATEIARGYEEAGEYERAKWLLEVLQKLDPKLPGLKEKIDQLTEKMLESSEFEVELDVSRGWTIPIGLVHKDKIVRIEANGDYEFAVALRTTADGLPTDDNGNDLVGGIPVGALMGMIVNPENRKPGKPFEIKSKREWTPQQTGLLRLNINLPNGHKSSGKLKVKLSGVTRPAA